MNIIIGVLTNKEKQQQNVIILIIIKNLILVYLDIRIYICHLAPLKTVIFCLVFVIAVVIELKFRRKDSYTMKI